MPDAAVRSKLQQLPAEIIQYIAYLLPSDTDVTRFSQTCTFVAAMVLPSESSVWRALFGDKYDVPSNRSSTKLKIEYQIRSIVLSQKMNFKNGQTERQLLWLVVLRDMLVEISHLPVKIGAPSSSKSFKTIREILLGSEFLNRPVSGYGVKKADPPSELFCALQLCLTDVALDPAMGFSCLRTDYDIQNVYSYEADITQPLVNLQESHLEKILHIRNFWFRHLLNPFEETYFSSYTSLPTGHRLQPQQSFTQKSAKLSSKWLGYYSCIHPYPKSLSALENRQTCADLDTHLDQVEPMTLQIKPDPSTRDWPDLFQPILQTLGPDTNRTFFRGTQRTYGVDNDDPVNFVRGFTESIASYRGGFNSWARICFVLYEAEHDPLLSDEEAGANGLSNDPDTLENLDEDLPSLDLEVDFVWIHAYEGLLLPSQRIMMGRWIDMVEQTARGPFIFWDL